MNTALRPSVYIQADRKYPVYSYHAMAAQNLGFASDDLVPMETHGLLYDTLAELPHAVAVVAVANTTKGPIHESYGRLKDYAPEQRPTVVGRTDVAIQFSLFGIPGATIADVQRYHTQSHAAEQCPNNIVRYLPKRTWVETRDTAGSAFAVRDLNNIADATICPRAAGLAAGLACLIEVMEDEEDNITTFYQIGNGDHATIPDNATVAVAALHSDSPYTYRRARAVLERHYSISMRPLNAQETTQSSLIVELEGIVAADQPTTIAEMNGALGNLTLTHLGGYAPQRQNALAN